MGDILDRLVEEGSNRILGTHILGSHVEELVNLFAMAVRFNLRSKDDLRLSNCGFRHRLHHLEQAALEI